MVVSLREEVGSAEFGDKRLDKRLGLIVKQFGAKPNLSIPAATDSRAEMEGAYRFFDNDKVTPEKILQPHFDATRERISQVDFALLVQDTSDINLTRPNQQVAGAGPMDSETRRGCFLHPLVAFTLDGLPLGAVWQKTWARSEIETELSEQERNQKRAHTPIEEKESIRWLEGLRAAREVANACPATTCVCVSDSESDIYELFSEPRTIDGPNEQVHLIVRACQTCATTDQSNWLAKARESACLYECTIDVSARKATIAPSHQGKRSKPREARIAQVEVRATTVTVRPPWRHDRKLPKITVNVILVEETNPPDECEPIQWILITTLPIDHPEQVQRIVRAYCTRWQIEIFFRTIKSGCRIEKRQFETLKRLENCIAVYSIVAWRIMYLCRLGRECPDLDCEVVFEPCEWKAVYVAINNQEPPETPPRLNEIIRMVASLGGYVIRKSTEPGPQTLWLGLQRVHDLSTAWNAFGPGSQIFFPPSSCVVR